MDKIKQKDFTDPVKSATSPISQQLLSLCESSTDPWGIKDVDSCYMYGNKAYLELLNLPSNFNIEGRLDREMPHPISEFSSESRQQDRQAQESQKKVSVLDIHPYGREKIIQPYIFDKLPFYDSNGNCIGSIFHAKKLQFYSPMNCVHDQIPISLLLSPPCKTFSIKELDVIFYALQSFSAKEIARELNLSHRTIENKMQEIYRKATVCSLKGLKDYCRERELDKYIPPKFLRCGSHTINCVSDYNDSASESFRL